MAVGRENDEYCRCWGFRNVISMKI
jgi:hypothetical protein